MQNTITKDLFDEAQRHNPNRAKSVKSLPPSVAFATADIWSSRRRLLPVQITGYAEMGQRVNIQLKSQQDQSNFIKVGHETEKLER